MPKEKRLRIVTEKNNEKVFLKLTKNDRERYRWEEAEERNSRVNNFRPDKTKRVDMLD